MSSKFGIFSLKKLFSVSRLWCPNVLSKSRAYIWKPWHSCSEWSSHQWSFLVPLIGGRYHIIPQLAVYTTYILPIGWLNITYHLLREPETAIEVNSSLKHSRRSIPRIGSLAFVFLFKNSGWLGRNGDQKPGQSSGWMRRRTKIRKTMRNMMVMMILQDVVGWI